MEPVTSANAGNGMPVCHVVTPVGMLGYGFDEKLTETALESLVSTGTPTAIILDSGSTDSGPEKLALGVTTCPRSSYYRDLSKLLKLVYAFHVPLIFSSAGETGLTPMSKRFHSSSRRLHYRFKVLAIFAGIDKAIVLDRLRKGSITGCGKSVPPLTENDVENSTMIMSQLGPEPFLDAMAANPDFDVIVGGRAYDPAPYFAYAAHLMKSQLAMRAPRRDKDYLGLSSTWARSWSVEGFASYGAVATVYDNGTFDIVPTLPTSRCTPLSVAAHTLYEKSRPDLLYGPGGWLDLTKSTYEQMTDGRTVRVAGSTFHFSEDNAQPYQLKLEAATIVGYRSMYMGTIRDPILIHQIDPLLDQVRSYITAQHTDVSDWDIHWHIHGKDESGKVANDIFLIGEVIAPTQAQARAIASTARVGTMHGSYLGQKATSGNFGFGIGGKVEIELGPCAKFSIYHLMDLKEGEKHLFSPPGPSGIRQQGRIPLISTIGRGEKTDTSQDASSTTAKELPINLSSKPKSNKGESAAQTPADSTPNSKAEPSPAPTVLGDITRVLRSKNAGPYEITLDAMFESEATYQTIKHSGLLSEESVAAALGVSRDHIVWCGFFDPARAFKVTIPRIRGGKLVPAGGYMEDDVHGTQQHLELFNMKLSDELLARLAV
ncbi:hypothetical protein PG994_001788 [Apiospora phragmitis]|uniref:Caib baif family enzyme n=1 Tax=Apiospora phragmitis TaxID=2905665 RepID=A0ABR1WUF1_9PEZI